MGIGEVPGDAIEGVDMYARIEDTMPAGTFRRGVAPGVRVLKYGLLLLAGLAVTVLGFGRFVAANEEAGAYRTALVCGTAAATPGTDCVRHETGKVTDRYITSGGDSTIYTLTVTRETDSEHDYEVNSALYYAAQVGADVDLAVFRGRVAEVSHQGHRAPNPGSPYLASLEVALLVGLGSVLTAQGLAWSRSNTKKAGVAIAAFVVPMAFLGSLVLVSSQWPLAATLAVPVLGWLFMTASATAAARDA